VQFSTIAAYAGNILAGVHPTDRRAFQIGAR
jgi:hypothetical protein